MQGGIRINLNGEEKEVQSTTVSSLIAELGLSGKKIAVELNKEIVSRNTFETVTLSAGDTLEIIQFVGGG